MGDKRNCEKFAAQASKNLGINNNYGPRKNIHYVQRCVSEVHSEEKVAVQLSVVIYVKYGACSFIEMLRNKV
jgi:hypothetical protein